VDYAGRDPIGGIEWDLDNDGNFAEPEEPSGLTQNITWSQLLAVAGINDDGLYTIAARATNSVGTTTRFRTLTVTDTIPTVGEIPATTVNVGEQFTIPLSATDPGDDHVIGWEIIWEVDPNDPSKTITTKLGPEAKSASYTFERPTEDLIIINVFDDQYGPDNPAGQLAWNYNAGITFVPTGGPYIINQGEDLTLNATPYGTPSAVAWTFSDGTPLLNSASGTIPWNTLEGLLPSGVNDGNYAINVTGTYISDITSAEFLTITNVAPTATLTNNGPVNEGSATGAATVSFTNQFDPSSADTTAGFTYDFYFGDEQIPSYQNVTAPTVDVPAAFLTNDGALDVRGVIKDRGGAFNEYTTSIQINEVAPTINFQASTNQTNEGVGVTFTATVTDPGNEPLDQIVIDWGDGEVTPIDNLDSPITHHFRDDGNLTVKLSVWSDGKEYEQSLNLQVDNAAPVVSNLVATPLIEGQRVKLTGDVIDPGIDDGTFVDVLFGNGLGTVIMLQPGETSFETYVTYEDDGNYQIEVSATDDDGLKSSTEALSIAVANDAPSLTLNPGNKAIFEATPWTLRGLITDSGKNDRYNITIDWDDPQGPGNTALTDQGPSFE
ncbi:MAG: PKD domain-containing protein, partial [Planctomycetota bacterium]